MPENNLELLVTIAADTAGSKASLNAQLDKLSKELDGLKNISLGINKEDIKALKDIANIDFSKLKEGVSKPIAEGVAQAGKEIKELSRMTEEQFKKAAKESAEAIGREFSKIGKIDAIADIEKQIKAIDSSAIVEVTKEVTKAGEVVKGLTASYKEAGIQRKIAFEQVRVGTGNTGDTEVIGWSPKLIKEVDMNLKQATDSASLFVAKVDKLQQTGKITNQQFEELTSNIGKIGNADGGLQKLNTQADNFVASNKRIKSEQEKQTAELKIQEQLQEKIRKLTNTIITEQKRNPKGFGNDPEVKGMLDTLQKIDPASKGAATAVKGVSDGFGRMKAEATEAGRSSMGVMESFKIAMEKFPIWMAASTLFFGAVRTAKTFGTVIVDIDTKMVSLRKVMSENTDFEAVFDRATQSAENFGQSISQVMDSYIEFAKQGYKDIELGQLADSGVVASNVGDITAQRASEYMTASLVQWKMDAKESMGIIDSWNEISNNYATTTEKLAQGQA